MSKDSLVTCQDLTVIYPNSQTIILDHLSFTIEKGEFICVLGPSGCGKSTLLNIIAGYLSPTKGQALFKGEAIQGPSWQRGVMFQQQALYPWLDVFENVAFGLKVRQQSPQEIQQKVPTLLKMIGLEDYTHDYIFNLSGGMQQRVQLARVLANDPELILMDEPLGALDAITRTKIQALLRKLWHQGNKTYFMITHDIDEALSLATKIIVLSKNPGRIIKTYQVNYTSKAYTASHPNEYMDNRYLQLKDEIYDMLAQE
ncbi:ABC transporter ATP-binding protein [Aerococcus christensenii]|uniref:ABC transporter ATP-binding protein n=1 Tax=Aerococcus christensenii TaxID=87541 RepID=UPI003F43C20A